MANTANGCNYTCSSSCLTCFGPGTYQCLTCPSGTYLQLGQCISACTFGFYQSSSQCLQCSAECYSCTSSQNCLTCSPGHYNMSSNNGGITCVRLCPTAYYPTNSPISSAGTMTSGQCLPCPTGCLRCKNPNFCMLCSRNYYLFNLTCLPSPPISHYYDRKVSHFKPCQPNCLHCNELVCSFCASGYFLDQGTCVTDCGPHKYKVLSTTSVPSSNEND